MPVSSVITLVVFVSKHLLYVLEQAMERDKFMNPSEAKDFGILDLVLEHPPLPTNETEQSQSA